MSSFSTYHSYFVVSIETAYELEQNFELKSAKSLRREFVQKQKQLNKFANDYKMAIKTTDFKQNIKVEQKLNSQLAEINNYLQFLDKVLAINVVTSTGYYMFIKEIIAYSHLLM